MTRSTSSIVVEFLESAIFQLTTSRRGRPQKFPLKTTKDISTHDLTKRSTRDMCAIEIFPSFQLTTSRRGRRMKPMLGSYSITFQLTTSRRGRHYRRSQSHIQLAFQLTTSRRGRRNRNHCDHDQGNFNSRPHEEVDTVSIGLVAVLLIFQLTTSRRGRQLLQIEQTVFHGISTHDLTKRSTDTSVR